MYVGPTIDSVLAQEFLDYELIIVDDCFSERLVVCKEKGIQTFDKSMIDL